MYVNACHYGPTIATRDELKVIDCRACGWAHLDPLLPAVDDAYYRDTFWSEKGAGWLARYEAERDWLDMRNGDWLSVVEEHVTGKNLLDVGAGYGFFMQAAYARGWRDFGIEPSEEAKQYTYGKCGPISQGMWQDAPFTLPFNCISALWLMEHLPNPFEFLAWARAHLAPGGVLLLCVPQEWNVYQMRANMLAKVHNYWLHPTHLNYWSTATFYGMLGRAGFKVVDVLGTYPMEEFIISGKDYTDSATTGDECHAIVRARELKQSQKEHLQDGRERGRMGYGRDLVVVCK